MNDAPPEITPAPASILIVDDNPTNRKVLHEYLEGHHHHILVAEDGETAIEQAQYSLPDLILLDVMMPGIDGFETCLRLKRIEATRDIPVIFMTALADTPFILRGFSVGAVDYLTKPLQLEEVNVRVGTHIHIRRLQKELQKEIQVRRKVEEELRIINAGKDRFFSIIAHDLKNPMHGAVFFSEVLVEAIRKLPSPESHAELLENAKLVHEATGTVGRLLLDLLAWAEIQMRRVEINPIEIDLGHLIKMNVTLAQTVARQKEITLVNATLDQPPIHIRADERMIDTVVRNLLGNAVKFTQPGGRIEIGMRSGVGEATVFIADSGVGIPAEKIGELFEVGHSSTYGTRGESGSGLGLMLCKDMVERNEGRIWAESEVGKGSTFSFTVPLASPASA
ncbi:Signal transduction histidine kinase [Verrucomicrobium sp. GAS474]|uniref:hybrid sensor histidine kinase/response regulator n=1 Tax=Verrucomicrobium sp. GAS474 TaxID=1882831 RepID=UPI00087DD45A|nr:hybrid sensor histidine kinase/response regulator [Verrucomicrobium sp. GAS474]SDU12940.1 Signal transduction histidine kinase [Verrucomicrobium sp. GAS474]